MPNDLEKVGPSFLSYLKGAPASDWLCGIMLLEATFSHLPFSFTYLKDASSRV